MSPSLILCGLSWLAAGVAWVAAWAAVRECQIARRKLHRFGRGVIKDCYDAIDEIMNEAAEKSREPSNN